MAIYFRSSLQNFDNWTFWIRKNKCIIEFNKRKRQYYKTYLYAKDLSEPKYEFLIKKREEARMKHLNDPTAFFACSNTMQDIYEDSDDNNPTKKRKVLLFLMT